MMKHVYTVCFAFMFLYNVPCRPVEEDHYLVIGSRNLAYNVIRELRTRNKPVTVISHNKNEAAQRLIDPEIVILQGVIEKDYSLLERAAHGKKYIFFCPSFPYALSLKKLVNATQNIIDVAHKNNATIIFASHVCRVGNVQYPVYEDADVQACSPQGMVFEKIEKLLIEAAEKNLCRSLIVRHPYLFGPCIYDGLMNKIFMDALQKKPLTWINQASRTFQLAYAKDLARLLIDIIEISPVQQHIILHYAGYDAKFITPLESWLLQIAIYADSPATILFESWFKTKLLSFFSQDADIYINLFYLFENSIMLNDSLLRTLHPQFKETPLFESLHETLAWYQVHQNEKEA